MRLALAVALALLVTSLSARGQEWREVEVDVSQEGATLALGHQNEANQRERLRAMGTPAGSFDEAWRRLVSSLANVQQPRVELHADRIVLSAIASMSAITETSFVELTFELEPRVTSPNVLELLVRGGRQRWVYREWEDQSPGFLSANVDQLVDQINAAPGGGATARRADGAAGGLPRIVVDLARAPQLEGIELTGIRVREGALTVVGRTRRERLSLPVGTLEVNDGLGAMMGDPLFDPLDALFHDAAWVDVGHERPGRLTLRSTSDLPWLPKVKYSAVLRLDVTGPHQVTMTLEDVVIGGSTMDRALRAPGGSSIRRWVLDAIFERLDQVESRLAAAYGSGGAHLRMSHAPGHPETRALDLRPGWAGPATVRPGFELESIAVGAGHLDVVVRLPGAPAPSTPARGIIGALGGP